MSKDYMPFQNTTISERTSMASVQDLLEQAGFDQVGSIADKKLGRRAVIAAFSGAEFRFEVDITQVAEKAIEHLSDRKKRKLHHSHLENYEGEADDIRADIDAKALKVGWRLMHLQVKGLCDAIVWGVITPAQAFSGYMQLSNGKSVASEITQAIDSGKIKSKGFEFLQLEQS